jgi:hypothetical protein
MPIPNFFLLFLGEVIKLFSQPLGHRNQERRVCVIQPSRHSPALWLRVHGCNAFIQFICQKLEEFQPYVQLFPFLYQLARVERFLTNTIVLGL